MGTNETGAEVYFPLENVTEIIVVGQRMSSVGLEKVGVVGMNI